VEFREKSPVKEDTMNNKNSPVGRNALEFTDNFLTEEEIAVSNKKAAVNVKKVIILSGGVVPESLKGIISERFDDSRFNTDVIRHIEDKAKDSTDKEIIEYNWARHKQDILKLKGKCPVNFLSYDKYFLYGEYSDTAITIAKIDTGKMWLLEKHNGCETLRLAENLTGNVYAVNY
jgi:acetylornithine deacetylase/succinyl-diaminopimelate desuccinylase-like protein